MASYFVQASKKRCQKDSIQWSKIAESVDAVRVIGNFAAHPEKGISTNKILPVEEEEAEWLLEVVYSLLKHYFIEPYKVSKKKDSVNKKLMELGKKRLL